MGNQITYNDIVKADVNSQLKKLNELLLQTDKSIKSIKETGTQGKDLKVVTEQLQKVVTGHEKINTITKKRIDTEKLLTKEQNKRIKNAEKTNLIIQQRKAHENALANEIRKEAREIAVLAREEKQILVLRNKEIKSDKELVRLNAMLVRQRSNMIVKTREEKKAYNQLTREIVRNEKQIRRADKSIKRFQRNVGNYTSSIKGFATTLGVSLGLVGFIRLLKNVGNIFKTFEKDVKRLQAIVGSDKNIDALTKQAKELGASTVFTAGQIVGLQTELAKLGFTVREIVSSTTGIQALAAATGTDLSEAAVTAGSALKIFGLDASEAGRVADVLAKSTSISALDMQKLATALPTVGVTARIAGQSIERTTALLGVLSDRGLDASTSATALRNIFLQLSKKGITWEDALTRINNASDKNNESLKIFGVRSAAAGVIIAENTTAVNEMEQSLIDAEGAAQDMADTMLDNLAGDITLAQSAWEDFVLSIEDGDGAISTAIRSIIKGITNLLSELTELNRFGEVFTKSQREASDKYIESLKEQLKGEFARVKLMKVNNELANKRIELQKLEEAENPFRPEIWSKTKKQWAEWNINNKERIKRRKRDIFLLKDLVNNTEFLNAEEIKAIDAKKKNAKALENLTEEEAKRLAKLAKAAKKAREKALLDREKSFKKEFKAQQELELSRFLLITDNEKKITAFKLGQQAELLQYEIDFNAALSDIQKEALANRIELLNKERDAVIESQANIIADAEKVILKETAKKKPSFLSRLLGVNEDEIGRIKSMFSDAFNQFMSVIADRLSIERQANDERLEMADERIQKTGEELKAERDRLEEIQEKGQATDSRLENSLLKRLDAEKKAKEKALAEDKRLKQRQKRLDIISAQINTFQSISNALSIKPVWLGIVMAAIMGGLGLAQVRNIQSAKYAEGTRYLHLDGNAPGRDTIPAIGKDGSPIMLDEGERILSKRQNSRIARDFPNELIPEAIQFYKEGGGPTNIIGGTDNGLLEGIYHNTKNNGIEYDSKGRIIRTPTMNITYA